MSQVENAQTPFPIVEDIIGSTARLGRWQGFITLLMSLCICMHLMNSATEVMPPRSGWWCKKPPGFDEWPEFAWIFYSHVNVSKDSKMMERVMEGNYRGCAIYDIDYGTVTYENFTKGVPIPTNDSVACPFGVRYSNISGRTLVERFDKGCYDNGEIRPTTWLKVPTFGRVVGFIVFGVLGDRIGRKRVICFSCGATALTALTVALITHFEIFLVMSIIHGICHGGFVLSYVLVSEVSPNAWRSWMMAFLCTFHAIGFGVTQFITGKFETVSQLMLFVNVPNLVIFAAAEFIPESPAWLFCTKRTVELDNVVKKAADCNKSPMPENFRIGYAEYLDSRQSIPSKPPLIWDHLFSMEVSCEVLALAYLFIYSAIVSSISHCMNLRILNTSWAYHLLGTATSVGIAAGQVCLLLITHRKVILLMIILIFIISTMLLLALHEKTPVLFGPMITLYNLNIGISGMGYGALLNYNSRTIPTQLRGTYCGILRALRIFFFWAGCSQQVNFPKGATTLVVASLLALLFAINIRDLTNRELPDTLRDSIRFKDKQKPKRWTMTELRAITVLKQEIRTSLGEPSKVIARRGKPDAERHPRFSRVSDGSEDV